MQPGDLLCQAAQIVIRVGRFCAEQDSHTMYQGRDEFVSELGAFADEDLGVSGGLEVESIVHNVQ